MISVIIPSYRNPKCLDICLHSALHNQKNQNELICIIDGFVEESKHIIEKYKAKVGFIESPSNQGMQYSLNVGVWNSSNSKILIVNDDNVFPKDWDNILNEDFKEGLILTPNQIERSPSIFNFITDDYGGVDDFNFNMFTEKEQTHRTSTLTDDGEIFPFMISKTDYMMVGGFDTVYDSPFICDWDFFLKLELAGRTFKRTRKLNFYHFGSMATKNGKEANKFKSGEQEASSIFTYKWGIPPQRNIDNSHKPNIQSNKGINYGK
jgi:glycosyltransferase involved in cell wall biosynthesis